MLRSQYLILKYFFSSLHLLNELCVKLCPICLDRVSHWAIFTIRYINHVLLLIFILWVPSNHFYDIIHTPCIHPGLIRWNEPQHTPLPVHLLFALFPECFCNHILRILFFISIFLKEANDTSHQITAQQMKFINQKLASCNLISNFVQ